MKTIRIDRGYDTPCEEFDGAMDTAGYGKVTISGRQVGVHIVVWEQHHGSIPTDENGKRIGHVAHKCHNPPCCNIEHLQHGTVMDNIRMSVTDGRTVGCKGNSRGTVNGQAKLTEEQVLAIYSDTRILREIATEYGIGISTVSEIRTGKRWGHLTRKVGT